MRILLAGATGAIGRPLVRRLVDAGHDVVGLTRHADRARVLDEQGAHGVVCDVLDLHAVLAAARAARPDVVLDQTTDLPQRYDPRRMDAFYANMGPLRLIGSPNLLDAAREVGARHVFQSVAFLYAPDGTDRLRTEDDRPYGADAPPPWNTLLVAITALEQRALAHGGQVLRYGFFYGPQTHLDRGGELFESLRRRRFPVLGRGSGVFSFIHVDDAAAATVAALDRPEPGILNIVDDRPLPVREWAPRAAEAFGFPRPLRLPAALARPFAGPLGMHFSTTMPGTSNARARERLAWTPRFASLLDGLAA